MNVHIWLTGFFMLSLIEILDIKYLNNVVEQSHPKSSLGQAENSPSVRSQTLTVSSMQSVILIFCSLFKIFSDMFADYEHLSFTEIGRMHRVENEIKATVTKKSVTFFIWIFLCMVGMRGFEPPTPATP